jgi:geranylgeranyl diphosphate synthase type I
VIDTLPAALARTRTIVKPALHAAVETLSAELRRVVAYHLGWADADGAPQTNSGGKSIRPTLALLGAEASGGVGSDAVPGAVAIELVHNFSLLHDDVMDHDRTRRHRPTAWALYGIGPAICAGDALIVLAHEVLTRQRTSAALDADRLLARATATMIAGQADDLRFEGCLDVSVDDYLLMAARKTGALLGCAAGIGAVLAGARRDVVTALDTFGRHLGLAFQCVDDLLGIWGDPRSTGKPVGSDLRQRKASLPIIGALCAGGPNADELGRLLSNGALDERAVARATELVTDNGGRERTEREAAAQFDAALNALAAVPLATAARAELVELAHFVVQRDF